MAMAFSFLILLSCPLFGQLYEVSLEQRILNSEFILEGKVVESKSYWAPDHRSIYTSHLVKVDKAIAGNLTGSYVEIINEGGTVGDQGQYITHTLALGKGMRGIFFCNRARWPALPRKTESGIVLDVYASMQGFIHYYNDGVNPPAADPFRRYYDIPSELYAVIASVKGVSLDASWMNVSPVGVQENTTAISITDFFPDTVTAGTRTVLTIVGTEFGDSLGSVLFANADDGGMTMMQGDSVDILYWSSDTIRVYVPSSGQLTDTLRGTAGTGAVSVKDKFGNSALSTDDLYVSAAWSNTRYDNTREGYRILLIDSNEAGGYTFRYTASFSANDSAKNAFEWALRKWRCKTGVNFVVGADTNFIGDPKDDGICTIHWTGLSPGEIGRTTVRRNACISMLSGDLEYFTTNIDLEFDSTRMFHFDTLSAPPMSKLDFPSVALHELGHAHILDHVIERDSLMHFSASFGQTVRTISNNQLAAAISLLDSSTIVRPGCPNPIVSILPFTCANVQLASGHFRHQQTNGIRIFPNPITDESHIEISIGNRKSNLRMVLFDILGRELQGVFEGTLAPGIHAFSFDTENLPRGTYLIIGNWDGEHFVKKIIK
jgi:hypothetical protein